MPLETLARPTSVILNYGNDHVMVEITNCNRIGGVVWDNADAEQAGYTHNHGQNPDPSIHVQQGVTLDLRWGEPDSLLPPPPPPPPACYWVGQQLVCC